MYSSDAIYFSQKQLEADVLAVIRGVYNPSSGKSREKLASWPFIGQWINPLDPKIGKPYVVIRLNKHSQSVFLSDQYSYGSLSYGTENIFRI
jgi:hypothetical protein